MNDFNHELEVLLRAGYPLIYITTWEENRVQEAIKKAAKSVSRKCFSWTVTEGLSGEGIEETALGDPLKALNHIQQYSGTGIFILKDFHIFLKDHFIVRRLRDLVVNLKEKRKNIIFISPVLNIPRELEKEVTILEFTLPDFNELRNLFVSLVNNVKDNTNFKMDITEEDFNKIISSAMGLTYIEAENAFARIIVDGRGLSKDDLGKIIREKSQIIKKAGLLEFFESSESFATVGGMENLKAWCIKRKDAFSPSAKEFGLPSPKGILMVGVQGCGKSLMAKALSSFWNLPLLRFDVGRIFSGIVGSSEENVRNAIGITESIAPTVLWIDEIEKGFSGVQSSGMSDGGTTSRVFSTFLTWLQEKTSPTFVIATSNNISGLPPELLRKGRFDDIFFIDLPEQKIREDIFKIHIRKRNRNPDNFNLTELSEVTAGFNGAEIEQAVISGLYDAFYEKRELNQNDLLINIKETVPLSITM
ncbi:MAG TPA: AAA family ATPase, partial [Firmicutes bacterium]|nr:AAA family ATPase [Bacillota bacterium]